MKSQFLGGAYSLSSLPLSAQTCINLYPIANESKVGEVSGYYGTPGRKLLTTVAAGEGRGMCPSGGNQGTLLVVIGANVYAVTAMTANAGGSGPITYSVTQATGALGTTTGRVSMAANAAGQIAICDSSGMYVYNGTTGAVTGPVANGPTGQSVVEYMDGYGIFIALGGENATGEFGITSIEDFTTISALNVATAEALPDNLVSLKVTQREAWLLGNQTFEVWSDTGAASFPWERIPGGVGHVGCSGPFTPAFVDDTVFWVTRTPNGKFRVVRTIAYQTQYISNHAVEESLQAYQDSLTGASDTIPTWGYAYQHRGNSFYVLNIPDADITWVYHLNSGLWHRRAYRDTNGVLHRELGNAYAFWHDSHVILDPNNGNLYTLDHSTYTDNGQPIYRERAWPIVGPEELHRIRVDRIELDAETGVGNETGTDTNPQVWLDMSFDGGRTFGASRYQSLGKVGVYNSRAVWKRNGMGRRPVARIATTAETKIAWLGANVDGEILGQ